MAVDMNTQPPVQIGKELELVKRYVLLGMTMRILNHDIRVVGASPTKLPRLYESMLRGLQDRVLLELAALRKQFRESGIRIYDETAGTDGLTARYLCRGYEHSFSLIWSYVRSEAERMLKSHLKG
ncbi:hypothetical protein [Paenibacillus spongiae]|uniref:Uncharacterized protein n=1 Tax=Paenibacillus spongiae TaxID=2909671 RepID=A0ABY5S2V2_9BACL|nr:hypothetical protein [Paenibacillus spongiae]UVI28231.1 hypothetical protein L1F29_22620 [Paenibacillus spongiae]